MKSIHFCIIISALLVVAISCASLTTSIPTTAPTPSLDLQKTETFKADQTLSAQSTTDAQATQQANATSTAIMQKTQEALDKAATIKAEAIIKLTATSVASTAQAQELVDWIEKLAALGEITRTEGTFYKIDDLEKNKAKIDYFAWWSIDHSAENFAIQTDVVWEVASDNANWFNTGCGFVFAEQDDDFFHFLKLSLDGMATLRSFKGDNTQMIIQKKFGKPTIPSGQAKVLMIVQEKRVILHIDDQLVFNTYAPLLRSGLINLSLSSGINTGFGTRCKFTNIGLWIFD